MNRPTASRRAVSLRTSPVLVALVLAALALGCGLIPQRSPGEKLWRKYCAECHGLDGSGNTVRYMGKAFADLRDDTWKFGNDHLAFEQVIREGSFGEMPAFDHLTSQEIRLLVDYMRELRSDAPTSR